MKHVFVETNFLVDLLRPLAERAAEDLLAQNRAGRLRLHIPWCAVTEASRTLARIIDEDLGFTNNMIHFATKTWLADRSVFDKTHVDKLKERAELAQKDAQRTVVHRIEDAVSQMTLIEPSPAVVARTLRLFTVKSLKPFDEMVLGAVLAKAEELHAAGERDLLFCTLDGDLGGRGAVSSAYAACGLIVQGNFMVEP